MDEKTVRTKEKYWGGRDLPFPILHDAKGKTIEAYGVDTFPTLILIDPEGKVVLTGFENVQEEALSIIEKDLVAKKTEKAEKKD